MEHPELIEACKRNDLKAQMRVYTLYKDMLYNVSLRIVKNEHDAQDIVHDTFIKAFKSISKLEDDLHLGAWLKRISINCSLDFLRKKKKLDGWQQLVDIEEEGAEIELFEDISLKVEAVKKAIHGLKDKYRIIIVLYLIEAYSHKEIAQQLGLKESTVRNQYIRGKRLLLAQLQNKFVV